MHYQQIEEAADVNKFDQWLDKARLGLRSTIQDGTQDAGCANTPLRQFST